MKFSKKGYLRNSPDVNKSKNIIQGGNITMKGVDFKVHGVDNNGYAKVMTPGYDYNFPNAKYVIETPIKKTNMSSPFQKKFCGKSPFRQEIDPTQLEYETTSTARTLSGEIVPTSGSATVNIPGTREKRNFSTDPEERARQKQWIADNPQQYEKMIAETKPREVIVTRERDYGREVKTYPNPFKGMRTYNGIVLDAAARDRDSLESKTITNIFKRADDVKGFQAYLDEHGYRRTRGNNRNRPSEKLSEYKYTVNPRSGN